MQRAFVLSDTRSPMMPCHPARARELLRKDHAVVFRRVPFTIILKHRTEGESQEIELKVDPGSKVTGVALVGSFKRGKRLIFSANIEHRGQAVKDALEARRAHRRSRRSRKTRYRAPRFNNRTRPKGWLPPSLLSRVDNVKNWTKKILIFCPSSSIAIETARFDMQKINNPEISGIEYQQGELLGYEVREYLLEKWQRRCAYCHVKDLPLEIEHIEPKSRGGSNRVSNLALACKSCNKMKSNRPVKEFLHDKIRLAGILSQAQASLKDAAAVNSSRYAIGQALKSFGIPVSFWSGGRTKFNRVTQGYPKDHWIDAACVGKSGARVFIQSHHKPLFIQAEARGSRQKCLPDRFGFPRTASKGIKRVYGFQTGDMVEANVTKGKKTGRYVGRVAVRKTGNFNIKTQDKVMHQGISHRYCRMLQRIDGYSYS